MVSIEPDNREGPPVNPTEPRDIVVIGASRGGVEALKGIVAALPPSLQSALLIVLHISPTHASLLPDVLSRAGPLPAEHGRDGTRIERGRISVAPPDHHMTVGPIGSFDWTKVLRKITRGRPPIHSSGRRRAYMARA